MQGNKFCPYLHQIYNIKKLFSLVDRGDKENGEVKSNDDRRQCLFQKRRCLTQRSCEIGCFFKNLKPTPLSHMERESTNTSSVSSPAISTATSPKSAKRSAEESTENAAKVLHTILLVLSLLIDHLEAERRGNDDALRRTKKKILKL